MNLISGITYVPSKEYYEFQLEEIDFLKNIHHYYLRFYQNHTFDFIQRTNDQYAFTAEGLTKEDERFKYIYQTSTFQKVMTKIEKVERFMKKRLTLTDIQYEKKSPEGFHIISFYIESPVFREEDVSFDILDLNKFMFRQLDTTKRKNKFFLLLFKQADGSFSFRHTNSFRSFHTHWTFTQNIFELLLNCSTIQSKLL